MVSTFMTALIAIVVMLVAPISPVIAQYAGIIVSYGFSIQLILNIVIEMITNTEAEMPAIERMSEYAALENENVVNNKNI